MTHNTNLSIGCWLSNKKVQKFDWNELEDVCRKYGFRLFNVDLNKSLESQKPFHVFLHKLTDIIVSAIGGNAQSIQEIKAIEDFLDNNPSIIVIDPIENVRKLLDRFVCYSTIRSTNLHNLKVFTPNFCKLVTQDVGQISQTLNLAKVTYPFICKPVLGHGSEAHKMSIIFNENQLDKCKIPCVAQSFINHNAVLYKLFLVGRKHFYIERPSIKNFHTTDLDVITFQSSEVSKAKSQSDLCVLDSEDRVFIKKDPDPAVLEKISVKIREEFQMDLLGVDIVISSRTSRYAVIDVNVFPGYDGFPDFYESLLKCIEEKTSEKTKSKKTENGINNSSCHSQMTL